LETIVKKKKREEVYPKTSLKTRGKEEEIVYKGKPTISNILLGNNGKKENKEIEQIERERLVIEVVVASISYKSKGPKKGLFFLRDESNEMQ
jgi:DNA gyrase/topoisomerase IV subunit A